MSQRPIMDAGPGINFFSLSIRSGYFLVCSVR